jgi:hypothetical protein
VALVFFVPLTDLSLIPSVRFPGWQWALIGCTAPVALWSAWPFHQAALKNLRHGTLTMDTLVSLGVIAACAWPVWAMFTLDRGTAGRSGLHELPHGSGGGIYLGSPSWSGWSNRPRPTRRPSSGWPTGSAACSCPRCWPPRC